MFIFALGFVSFHCWGERWERATPWSKPLFKWAPGMPRDLSTNSELSYEICLQSYSHRRSLLLYFHERLVRQSRTSIRQSKVWVVHGTSPPRLFKALRGIANRGCINTLCAYYRLTCANTTRTRLQLRLLTYWRFSSHFSSLSDRPNLQQQAVATREWCRNCLQILILEPKAMLGQTTHQVHPQSTAASRVFILSASGFSSFLLPWRMSWHNTCTNICRQIHLCRKCSVIIQNVHFLKREQDELFPIATDLKIHLDHPKRGLAVSWASVMRIRDGTRPFLPRLNTGITVVLIHSSQLTKQTVGVWRGFEAWKTSGQAQGEPSVQGCLVERKLHSTLHKPPEAWERHTEIKMQWTASFLHVRSNPGKSNAQQEPTKRAD